MRDRTMIAAGVALVVLAPAVAGAFAGVKTSNAVLAIAAGAVAGAGVIRGVYHLKREFRDLQWRFRGIHIINRSELTPEAKQDLCDQTLPTTSTWEDVYRLRQVTRLAILEQAADNTASIVLTILGLAAGTAASVWSVWI
ncbi:hypothetical protein ABT224_16255 [Streptomyces sp. NPDC001584]|uniref:hypothetical protein n=1 Tax=Streptomyces sp. NPDC001584 TaxID=3154521 RepID=UPI00331913AE